MADRSRSSPTSPISSNARRSSRRSPTRFSNSRSNWRSTSRLRSTTRSSPGRQEVKLVSQRKRLTVFFSDIAGFTETTERLQPEDLTHLLNHYLTEMSQIALAHGATIDKYVGDAILIFFGDPETRGAKEDAIACVKMALAMRKRMSRSCKRRGEHRASRLRCAAGWASTQASARLETSAARIAWTTRSSAPT